MNAAFSGQSFSTQSFSILAFAFEDQKKPGGSSGYDDWAEKHAAFMRLARIDQQDLLDIVTILGFVDIDEL